MRHKVTPTLLAILILCWSSPDAFGAGEYSRFLLPLNVRSVAGAYGSRWTSETWLQHTAGAFVTVIPTPFCFGFMCVDSLAIDPGLPPLFFDRRYADSVAVFLHVERPYQDAITIQSRIRDVSRSASTAGTQVPVPPESALRGGPLRLTNIPVDGRFRDTLRVYALPDEVTEGEVEVRYYRMPVFGGSSVDYEVVLLHTETLHLIEPENNKLRRELGKPLLFPLYGERANFQAAPELAGENALWVEAVPTTPGLRIWAMVSVTNNDTQHVTLIAP